MLTGTQKGRQQFFIKKHQLAMGLNDTKALLNLRKDLQKEMDRHNLEIDLIFKNCIYLCQKITEADRQKKK